MSATISLRLRFQIFKRDRFTCRYCGARGESVVLEVDHVRSRFDGGDDSPSNLVTACFGCNRGKGRDSSSPVSKRSFDQMPKTEGGLRHFARCVWLAGRLNFPDDTHAFEIDWDLEAAEAAYWEGALDG